MVFLPVYVRAGVSVSQGQHPEGALFVPRRRCGRLRGTARNKKEDEQQGGISALKLLHHKALRNPNSLP